MWKWNQRHDFLKLHCLRFTDLQWCEYRFVDSIQTNIAQLTLAGLSIRDRALRGLRVPAFVGRVREPTELCVRSWDELGVEQALDKKFFVRVSECEPSARESDKSKDFNATESLWHKNAATLEFPDLNYLAKNTFCLMTTCAANEREFRMAGQGRIQRGRWPPPLKPTKVTIFTVIFYNSKISIRNIRPICPP